MSIQFDWTAFNPDNGGDTDPPQTTIGTAPGRHGRHGRDVRLLGG